MGLVSLVLVNDCRSDVSPVNNSVASARVMYILRKPMNVKVTSKVSNYGSKIYLCYVNQGA